MAKSCLFTTAAIFFLLFWLGDSQNTGIQQCSTGLLLQLAPCAPFVQAGTVSLPSQQCCNGLIGLYSQRPKCVCFLLNNINLPINNTLALQLPSLCNLNIDPTSCSVRGMFPLAPTTSPATRVPFGATTNSTRADPPVVRVLPRGFTGFGFGASNGMKVKIEGTQVVAAAAITLVFLGFQS